MASYRFPHRPQDPSDGSTSIFLPTVSLYEWWLIRPESGSDGTRVGVAGFTSRKGGLVKGPVRVFKSAPITKVYDFSTLGTADNVSIVVNGFMNKFLTAENGFSPEVCKKFVIGFPANWEKLVAEEGNSSDTFKTAADQVTRSKKDQKSPRRQKSKQKNQPSSRTEGDCFTENVAGDLGSDLPEDSMEGVGEDPPSAPPLVKSKGSSHHHMDQSSPGVNDQTGPGKQKSAEGVSQSSVRTRSHYDTECTPNQQPRDDIDVTREEPSSAPPPLKSKISFQHHIDLNTPGKHKSVKNASQTGVEPSTAPPLVTPRRQSRRQIVLALCLGKGDVRKQTTTSVVTPQTKVPQDAMQELRVDPSSSSAVVKSKSSSHHRIGQTTPGKKDQASPRKHKRIKIPSQTGEEPSSAPPLVKMTRPSRRQIGTPGKGDVRSQTTTPVATQTKVPQDAMEESRVDPSSASTLAKSKSFSHHHIGQTTPGKKDQASPGKHKRAKIPSQTEEGPSSAPPLVKPRRPSRRQIGTPGKGEVRRQTTPTPVATPQAKGMVSPDSFKRSRSGRILLPPLAFWRNELPVYDANRNVAGVQGLEAVDSQDIGNKSRRK